jgi:hypothetical protein
MHAPRPFEATPEFHRLLFACILAIPLQRVLLLDAFLLTLSRVLRCYWLCLSLAGDAAVGKSSSVERFVKNEFFEFQQPTIGAAFLTQTVQLEGTMRHLRRKETRRELPPCLSSRRVC